MQNVICSGWLLKTGGAGHNYKNTKTRWFELRGMYLFYFPEQPKEDKEMKLVKGMIFLPGCDVKYEEPEHRLYFRTSGGKVYYLQVDRSEGGSADLAAEKVKLRSWMKAIQWSMNAARGFKDMTVQEGNWLHKRGGKSHGFVNWKKRRFALRGNLLLYYSEDPEMFDVFPYLKGYIDLASITSIDANQVAADAIDKPIYFKLTVDNEREFFIAAQSQEQKRAWIKAIKKQTKDLATRLNYTSLRSIQKNEKVIFTGQLFRLNKYKEGQRTYVVLTNVKLRYYNSEGDFDVKSVGSNMIGSIPLLGTATQILKDSPYTTDRSTIQMHDLQGHTFTFIATTEADAKKLADEIRSTSRALISSVIAKETTISLNTYALGKNGNEYGFTIAQIDKSALTLINLTADKDKRIEWDEIDRVSLTDDKFSLKYARRSGGKPKTIEFKSANAIAFFDTISVVMTLRDEIAEKEKKLKAKGITAPAKITRSNSSKATPIAESMIHARNSDKDLKGEAAAAAVDEEAKKKKKPKKTEDEQEAKPKEEPAKPKDETRVKGATLPPPSDPKASKSKSGGKDGKSSDKEAKPAEKPAKSAEPEAKPAEKEAKPSKPAKAEAPAAEASPVAKPKKKKEEEEEEAPAPKKEEAVPAPTEGKPKKKKAEAEPAPVEAPTPKKKTADSPAAKPKSESPTPKAESPAPKTAPAKKEPTKKKVESSEEEEESSEEIPAKKPAKKTADSPAAKPKAAAPKAESPTPKAAPAKKVESSSEEIPAKKPAKKPAPKPTRSPSSSSESEDEIPKKKKKKPAKKQTAAKVVAKKEDLSSSSSSRDDDESSEP